MRHPTDNVHEQMSDVSPLQGNAFEVLMNPPKKKTKPPEPIVWGVVYRRTLVHLPDNEPLKGTPYVGQAVRGGYGSAIEIAKARWYDENKLSMLVEKQIGLTAALSIFGIDAFHNEILESKYGPRDEVQAWADKREIELIAEHGGTLRDMEPTRWIHQTFNIQAGGKGKDWWRKTEAKLLTYWKRFCVEIVAFVDEHKTAYVTTSYVSPTGYSLGNAVSRIRTGAMLKGRPDEFERRNWLESLRGWTWDATKSEELRNMKQSLGNKQFASAESRAAASESMKKTWSGLTSDERQSWSANIRLSHQTEEYRNAQSQMQSGSWSKLSQDDRVQRNSKSTATKRHLEQRATQSTCSKTAWSSATASTRIQHKQSLQTTWKRPGFKEKVQTTRAATIARKKQLYIANARSRLLPFEPKSKNRVIGSFYACPDGQIGRWTGNTLRRIGPIAEPMLDSNSQQD